MYSSRMRTTHSLTISWEGARVEGGGHTWRGMRGGGVMAGGMHGMGCVHGGGMCGGGEHAWQRACMAEGVHGRVCMAGMPPPPVNRMTA